MSPERTDCIVDPGASIPECQEKSADDAWLTNFFTENHLDFETQPEEVASPEQVRFVVHLPADAIYYPCSTELFEAILNRQSKPYLHARYQEVWAVVEQLVQDLITDERRRAFLTELLRIKFEHDTHDSIMLPSRLKKRLLKIFIDKSKIDTPYFPAKVQRNKRVQTLLSRTNFWQIFNWIDQQTVSAWPVSFGKMERRELNFQRWILLPYYIGP